jgi:hypothetical protein
MNLGTVKMV